MRPSPEVERLLPGEEDVAFYEEHGYYVTPKDLETLERRLIGDENKSLKRVIALRKGQMSFHHCRMIHGSDVNRGDRPRTSIALHLQDGKNRYRPFLNERGEPWHITNDDLCRKDANGHPDYSDPAAFPSSGRPMAPDKARRYGPTFPAPPLPRGHSAWRGAA